MKNTTQLGAQGKSHTTTVSQQEPQPHLGSKGEFLFKSSILDPGINPCSYTTRRQLKTNLYHEDDS